MTTPATAGHPHPPAFELLGGALCIDFVNTADWRGSEARKERLHGFADLVRWAEQAGVLTPAVAERTRAAAERDPEGSARTLDEARRVRRVLNDVLRPFAEGEPPAPQALAAFNALLPLSLARLRVIADGGGMRWGWAGAPDDLACMLGPVVWSAATLLTSPERELVRACAGETCRWLYVDRSRNHARRWCDMRSCGNRAKARRFQARKRAGGER